MSEKDLNINATGEVLSIGALPDEPQGASQRFPVSTIARKFSGRASAGTLHPLLKMNPPSSPTSSISLRQ